MLFALGLSTNSNDVVVKYSLEYQRELVYGGESTSYKTTGAKHFCPVPLLKEGEGQRMKVHQDRPLCLPVETEPRAGPGKGGRKISTLNKIGHFGYDPALHIFKY